MPVVKRPGAHACANGDRRRTKRDRLCEAASGAGALDQRRQRRCMMTIPSLVVVVRSTRSTACKLAESGRRSVPAAGQGCWMAGGVGGEDVDGASQMRQDAFGSWVQLRHYELQEIAGDAEDLTTVGVLLTPRRDGLRDWDTTMSAVSGRIDLSVDDLALYRRIWSQTGP